MSGRLNSFASSLNPTRPILFHKVTSMMRCIGYLSFYLFSNTFPLGKSSLAWLQPPPHDAPDPDQESSRAYPYLAQTSVRL